MAENDGAGVESAGGADQEERASPRRTRMLAKISDAFRIWYEKTKDVEYRRARREWLTIILLSANALIFYWQLRVSDNTAHTLRDSMIASTRAWLAPVQVEIDNKLISTGRLNFSVFYGNVGKEPASGFVAQEDIGFVTTPDSKQNLYDVFPAGTIRDVCARTYSSPGAGTVYPSALRDYTYSTFAIVAPADMPNIAEIGKGTKAIFVHGCFAYQTFGIERKSEYCFLRLPSVELKPKKIDFRFVRCPYGNDVHEPR